MMNTKATDQDLDELVDDRVVGERPDAQATPTPQQAQQSKELTDDEVWRIIDAMTDNR